MLARTFLLLSFAFALLPAANAANAVSAQELAARTKTLGVLVLAGQQLDLFRIGVLVFGNKRAKVPAPDDALTELVFGAVKTQVDQEGAVKVRRVEISADDAARLEGLALQAGPKFWGGFQMDSLLPALAPYRAQCGCDALLVVASRKGEARPNSGLLHEGLGWVGEGGLVGDDVARSAVVAGLALFLVDAGSGEAAGMTANAVDTGQYGHSVRLTSGNWPTAMDAITQEQWASLWHPMAQHLWATLRRPLFQLGLKPSCTLYFHELHSPPTREQRGFPFDNEPPILPPGTDPARCVVLQPPVAPVRAG